MKRRLIIPLCVATTIIVAMVGSFLFGITRSAYRERECSLAMNVALLSFIETGKTNRATDMIETLLIGDLNALESMERSKLGYGLWHVLNEKKASESLGEKWEQKRFFAEARVAKKRDELNHAMSHPEETFKRCEEVLEKSFQESGRSNISVKVINGRKDSITMELENLF